MKITQLSKKQIILFPIMGGLALFLLFIVVVLVIDSNLPKQVGLGGYNPHGVTRVFAKEGGKYKIIAEFFKQKRVVIDVDKIPKKFIDAFVAAEDEGFFEHQGVSPTAIARAFVANLKAGQIVQGGSTITQQVARSLFLTQDRNIVRKIREAILAYRLEKELTKEQILYLYMNEIYLGNGAYGIQAASRSYFHKDAEKLSLAEVAVIASMPRAPSKFSPLINPKRAKERQLYVLRRMLECGYIKQEEMAEAAAQKIKVYYNQDLNKKYSSYYTEHVRRYILQKYGEKAVYEEGLDVYLPTSVELMNVARNSLREGIRSTDKRSNGFIGPIKKITDPEEQKAVLSAIHDDLIKKKVPYQVFLPDGTISIEEALKEAAIKSSEQLLVVGELYQGVVTLVDDTKKQANALVGQVEVMMGLDGMMWAQKNPSPERVSQVLAPGDLVYIKIIENKGPGKIIGVLEQKPIVQGAIYALEARTGYVLAMEGGYDIEDSEFNRAIQALRQPGSAFKPIIYSAGIEHGSTPASIIVDSPIVYEDEESGKWKPTNFEEKFSGDTTYRTAFIKSLNIPTIKLVQQLQVSTVIDYARRLGLTGQMNADLSISLGSAVVSLAELTHTYAIFARGGKKINPIFITKILDKNNNIIEEHHPPYFVSGFSTPVSQTQDQQASESNKPVFPLSPHTSDPDVVLDPRVAYVMTHMMNEVVLYGTGQKAKELGRSSAGKTGTTNDYIDAWFIGFTPHVVTGVWMGNDDLKSLGQGETGARSALPVWLDFMTEAVKNYPSDEFPVPQGVTFAWIDQKTGKRTKENAPDAIYEAFIEGTEPERSVNQTTRSTGTVSTPSEFLKEDFE